MSDSNRIKGTGDTPSLKRKHDWVEEKDILRKKKKKYSSSETEDSDSSSSSSSSSVSSSDSSTSSSVSSCKKKKKTKKRKQKLSKKVKRHKKKQLSKKEKKHRKKKKLKENKHKKKLKEKDRKKAKSKLVISGTQDIQTTDDDGGAVGPVPLPGIQEVPDRSKRMAPMTKEEWEKRQNVVRRVFDEATGRHRLIKGDGEVLEEIVSKLRHQAINRQATQGDGTSFQKELALKLGLGNRK